MNASTLGFEVVTVATQPEDPTGWGHLDVLVDSCRACDLKLHVLGGGVEWKGSAMRLLLFADFLAGVPDDAVYAFVDAYDVVLLPNAIELASRFRAFEAPLVFSAEVGCWPFSELAVRYPPAPVLQPSCRPPREAFVRPPPPVTTPYRFINAGSYIGYAGAIRKLLHELAPRGDEDDQGLFTRYYLDQPGTITLDHEASLFQSLHLVPVNDLVFEDGETLTLRNRWLGSRPCLLHGNGAGRKPFAELVRRLRRRDWPPHTPALR